MELSFYYFEVTDLAVFCSWSATAVGILLSPGMLIRLSVQGIWRMRNFTYSLFGNQIGSTWPDRLYRLVTLLYTVYKMNAVARKL